MEPPAAFNKKAQLWRAGTVPSPTTLDLSVKLDNAWHLVGSLSRVLEEKKKKRVVFNAEQSLLRNSLAFLVWLRWIANNWLKKNKMPAPFFTGTCFMELLVWETFTELINACVLKISTLVTSHLQIYLKPYFLSSRVSYYIQHLSSNWQAHTFVTKAHCQRR